MAWFFFSRNFFWLKCVISEWSSVCCLWGGWTKFSFQFLSVYSLSDQPRPFCFFLADRKRNQIPILDKQKSIIQFYFSSYCNFINWFRYVFFAVYFSSFLPSLILTDKKGIRSKSRYWASNYAHFCCIVIGFLLKALLQGFWSWGSGGNLHPRMVIAWGDNPLVKGRHAVAFWVWWISPCLPCSYCELGTPWHRPRYPVVVPLGSDSSGKFRD